MYNVTTTQYNRFTRRICLDIKKSLRARQKSCFLRPDTGPCRADIIQFYFDVQQKRCYKFFWGGCQGNGNRFETEKECHDHCYVDDQATNVNLQVPHFCKISFDYGTCFGYYYRWAWDKFERTCKRRIYSGCGGNQNNFEGKENCMKTCLIPPNNTMQAHGAYTTCIPLDIDDLFK